MDLEFVPRSEETRRRIIEATAILFNKQGYQGTSLADLTNATHLSKGGIYGNFKNKDEIAIAAFEHNLNTLQHRIAKKMAKEKLAKNKLLANIDTYYERGNDAGLPGGCPLQNTAIEADDTHDDLLKKAVSGFMEWKENLAKVIRLGIKNGEFKPNVDVDKVALSLIAIIEGAVLLGRATKQKKIQHVILDTARELVEGICIV